MIMSQLTRREVDAIKIIYGLNKYRFLDGTENDDGVLISIDQKLLSSGLELLKKRSATDCDSALVKLLEACKTSSKFNLIKTKYDKTLRGVWNNEEKVGRVNAFLDFVFEYLKKEKQKLRNICEDELAKKTLLGILNCNVFDYTFNQLFMVSQASKIRWIKKWFQDALESLIMDVEDQKKVDSHLSMETIHSASVLAQEIKKLDREVRVKGNDDDKIEKRKALEDQLFDLAEKSEDRSAVLGNATTILYSNDEYLSETGKNINQITEDQEIAMMAEGKSLIAAGAGSGKTKVLAGKVVYHIKEQEVPLDKMIAVAFNKEASNELIRRIQSFGGSLFDGIEGMPNFKTTHSFAQKVMRDASTPSGKLLNDYQNNQILEASLHQVSMGNRMNFGMDAVEQLETNKTLARNYEVEGLFDFSKARTDVQAPSSPQQEKVMAEEFVRHAVRKMLFLFYQQKDETNTFMKNRIQDMVKKDYSVFQLVARFDWRKPIDQPIEVKPYDMWDQNDKDALNAYIQNMIGSDSAPRAMKSLQESGLPKNHKFANDFYSNQMVMNANNSRNMWFNLGISKLSRAGRRDNKGKLLSESDGVAVNMEDIKSYIGTMMSSCTSPTEAFDEVLSEIEDRLAKGEIDTDDIEDLLIPPAIYGAYQYLKGELNPMGFTHDDSLILAGKRLIEEPNLLDMYRKQYSHILVDESQDLNRAQHLLYGLIAGQLDPSTGEPWDDGRDMTASVFTFIGDDKQGIYGFRGAETKLFTEKSDLRGGEFKTHILSTNFRSGRNIVQSANNLIAYNDDQIPMVCNANPSRDEGVISYQTGELRDGSLQKEAVDEIEDILKREGFGNEHYKVGIACRTNKELSAFALRLLAKGIPYYAKRPLLSEGAISSFVHLLGVASVNTQRSTDALLNLWSALKKTNVKLPFQLNNVFKRNLETIIKQKKISDPIGWFVDSGWRYIYKDNWRNQKNCKPYADALYKIRNFEGSPSELFDYIISGAVLDLNSDRKENDKIQQKVDEGKAEADDIKLSFGEVTSVIHDIVGRYDDLEECLSFMQNMTMIDQDSRKHSKRKDVVFLGTSHAWKGLEADHFFLPMSKDSFPDPRADEKEERRLAYVALTRGRDSVRVLCQEPYVINNKGDTRGGISKFVTEACIKDRDLLEIDKEASIDEDGMISKKGFDLFMKSHMTPQMMVAFKHLLK